MVRTTQEKIAKLSHLTNEIRKWKLELEKEGEQYLVTRALGEAQKELENARDYVVINEAMKARP